MQLIGPSGEALISCPVGIGRGGLKSKTSMTDCVTPTGDFVVDVVLSSDAGLNNIAEKQKSAACSRYASLVKDGAGLAKIFETMNAQDFNRDGKPDRAYGFAFIGLDGKGTGPKLVAAGNSARWYSIALHGTPNEKAAIGRATSEGCIHVPQLVLQQLLRDHLIDVGTRVFITDDNKLRSDVKRKSSADDNQKLVNMRN